LEYDRIGLSAGLAGHGLATNPTSTYKNTSTWATGFKSNKSDTGNVRTIRLDFVDFVSEAAWCPAAEQAQLDAHAIANTGALMSGLDYEFSLSDFDQGIELDSHTSQSQLTSDLMPSIGSPPPTPAKTRVSLACVACRSRHARCDATVPACSQCLTTGRTCSYAASRRRRGKASRVDPREKLLRDHEQIEIERSNQRNTREPRSNSHDTSSIHTSSSNFRSRWGSVVPAAVFQAVDRPSCSMPESDESSRFLDLYYAAFHAAHPFLLPHSFLNQRLQHNKSSLQSLLPVMHFVGSLFMPGAEKGALRTRAESALPLDELPGDGFIVQSLLIFGIALHSCNEFDNARKVLDHAIRIALQIGMQSKSFSVENGEGCFVLEESWRRTWWFLYATDSVFAGIRHCSTFSLHDIQTDVDLPCEEVVYESGVRFISSEPTAFALTGYRISHGLGHSRNTVCVNLLGRTLSSLLLPI